MSTMLRTENLTYSYPAGEENEQPTLALDGVTLEFEEDALRAVAAKAIQLNTGARGLRAILEDVLLELMFEIPSEKDIEKVIVTKASIDKTEKPIVVRKQIEEKKSDCIA